MLKLIIRLAYFGVIFIEGLIITRIALLVMNANLENNFANWVFNTSTMFLTPFEGIVTSSLQINNFTLELTPFVALLFYIIIAFVLSELLKSFSRE
ncbi:MAG TPA: YggT family protein [Candidatus Dojkabacteria bacterium]|nr:YggT family protein [Candidatus Dojkabacteria bacterium]